MLIDDNATLLNMRLMVIEVTSSARWKSWLAPTFHTSIKTQKWDQEHVAAAMDCVVWRLKAYNHSMGQSVRYEIAPRVLSSRLTPKEELSQFLSASYLYLEHGRFWCLVYREFLVVWLIYYLEDDTRVYFSRPNNVHQPAHNNKRISFLSLRFLMLPIQILCII